MKIFGRNIKVSAERWPWMAIPWSRSHKFGWGTIPEGRFGGGWHYRLGIDIATSSVLIHLVWGFIHITFRKVQKQ